MSVEETPHYGLGRPCVCCPFELEFHVYCVRSGDVRIIRKNNPKPVSQQISKPPSKELADIISLFNPTPKVLK